MNKFVVMIVVMVAGFGFMHWRYSKMAARAKHLNEVKKVRMADAQITPMDFSVASLDSPAKTEAHASCFAERSAFLALNLPEEQVDGFCRCLAVYVVAQVHPLVPEGCRLAGRWEFAADPACTPLDPKKPHQAQDRMIQIMKTCGDLAKGA